MVPPDSATLERHSERDWLLSLDEDCPRKTRMKLFASTGCTRTGSAS
jgi:hypothetical protein